MMTIIKMITLFNNNKKILIFVITIKVSNNTQKKLDFVYKPSLSAVMVGDTTLIKLNRLKKSEMTI